MYASNQLTLVTTSLLLSDTINDHLAASFDKSVKPSRYGVWAQGFGSWLSGKSDGNAAKLDSTTSGVISGIEGAVLPDWRVGVVGG